MSDHVLEENYTLNLGHRLQVIAKEKETQGKQENPVIMKVDNNSKYIRVTFQLGVLYETENNIKGLEYLIFQ